MTTGLFDLTGKSAIITGSSRGIGLAIARRMAEHGARVVISSRKADSCEEAAAAINADFGPGVAHAIAATLSSKETLEELVAATVEALGAVDILVCNAATNPHFGPLLSISDEQFRKILENNILANHWLVQLVAPGMIERRDGAILFVASIGGLRGSDAVGGYDISKAADLQMVRNLAVELGPHNIRVNAIAPGLIKTDFARVLWEDQAILARTSSRASLGRIGDPDEIAGCAVFLASPAGGYVTGHCLVADGGWIIRS